MKKLNKNVKLRDEILEPYRITKGDFYYFDGVPIEILEDLESYNFLDLEDRQNEAPTIKEFMDIMRRLPLHAHGYAVNVDREDYRISIEGVESYNDVTFNDVSIFRFADEFTLDNGHFRCWYD